MHYTSNRSEKFQKLVEEAAEARTTAELELIEKNMHRCGNLRLVLDALSRPQVITAEVILTHLIAEFYVETPFRSAMDTLLVQLKSSRGAVVVAGLGVVLRLSERVPQAITPEIQMLIRSYRYHSSPLIQWCSGQIVEALKEAATRS